MISEKINPPCAYMPLDLPFKKLRLIVYLEREGDYEGEDGVRAAGLVVHVGGGHRPRLVALHHQVVDLLHNRRHRQGRNKQESLNRDFFSIYLIEIFSDC